LPLTHADHPHADGAKPVPDQDSNASLRLAGNERSMVVTLGLNTDRVRHHGERCGTASLSFLINRNPNGAKEGHHAHGSENEPSEQHSAARARPHVRSRPRVGWP
jgi:hypothetical protein